MVTPSPPLATAEGGPTPELGALWLALRPQRPCRFDATPARSVQAALLRRLELLDPGLSTALHDSDRQARATYHPWTLSPLLGPLQKQDGWLLALPEAVYTVRVTALVPDLLAALDAALLSEHPLAREPLELEHVPFAVVPDETRWEGLSTYAGLLTRARPARELRLEFRSPTAFSTSRDNPLRPSPRLCLEGYVRKWNAFGSVALPAEELLAYAEGHLALSHVDLQPASVRLGRVSARGVRGAVAWLADGAEPALLRLVNALADYAAYCGTGVQTARGMGWTVVQSKRHPTRQGIHHAENQHHEG